GGPARPGRGSRLLPGAAGRRRRRYAAPYGDHAGVSDAARAPSPLTRPRRRCPLGHRRRGLPSSTCVRRSAVRILVGNPSDPSIRARGDMRAWTQRLLWFARPGDLLVLCCEPDDAFLDYALAHTGVKRSELAVLVAPAGAWGDQLLDPAALTAPAFVKAVRATLDAAGGPGAVSEVFALWPSASVARFAAALGIEDRF